MVNIVKPFKVLDVKEEPDGGQGVSFEVSKTKYLTESKTRTVRMRNYVSIPAEEEIDVYLFKYLSEGGWL